MTEDEMVGWHHRFHGHEFEQSPGLWWRTEEPGLLQSMGCKMLGQDLATEQQRAEWMQEVRTEDAEVSWWRVTPTGEL